jgi:hypothetical protein
VVTCWSPRTTLLSFSSMSPSSPPLSLTNHITSPPPPPPIYNSFAIFGSTSCL